MEIAPGIHRISCGFAGNRVAFTHLIVGSEAAMLVDTCLSYNPEQDILPYMQKIGVAPEQLKYILVSHSDTDHQGGNQAMKTRAPQALLICHKLDQPWIESTEALIEGRYKQFDQDHGFSTPEKAMQEIRETTHSIPVDITLEGGETFRLSPDWHIEIIHTPGHTWGHLAIYDPRSRTLLAGEAALWNAILDVDWNPALPPTYCYVDTYLATIDRLLGMDIHTFSPAHWPLQTGSEVGDFLRESRNYCLHLEDKLLDLARHRGVFTMKEAIEILAPQIGYWPAEVNDMLAFPFKGNLQRLTQRGRLIQSRNTENIIIWRIPS